MAEIIQNLEIEVLAGERAFRPRVCGRPTPTGAWEGWIELVADDGEVLRTPRETTQPNRRDLEYWASGLTPVYLEGALIRALTPPRGHPEEPPEHPAFDGPREEAPGEDDDEPTVSLRGGAVLDPFEIYERHGEELLRRQLGALSSWHLVNVVRACGLVGDAVRIEGIRTDDLVELVVAIVRRAAASSATVP